MARYMQNSTDIQINEVSGTDNINFSFKSGNSIDTKIGDLTQLNTTNKSNLVGAINEVNANDIRRSTYTTSEQVIGKWIDGKPLYRKVLNIGSHNWNETGLTFAHNISNLDVVIKNQWIGFYNNKWYYSWDNLTANNIMANSTDVIIYCNSSGVTFSQNYIILEYTKTTD